MRDPVFECQKCGQCCEGKGGIILGKKDLARLAAYLELGEEEFKRKYCEFVNGKIKIAPGPDGFCLFFKKGSGCAVHKVKPDVCRAWPFFRGNIVDAHSFEMARTYCPGISRAISHLRFSKYGREYLLKNELIAEAGEANALCLSKKDHEL